MQKPPFLERTIGNYCGVLPHFQNMSLAPTFFTLFLPTATYLCKNQQ
jgi:hypothetical protein